MDSVKYTTDLLYLYTLILSFFDDGGMAVKIHVLVSDSSPSKI